MEIEKEVKEVDKKIAWHFGEIAILKKYRKSLEKAAQLRRKVNLNTLETAITKTEVNATKDLSI